MEELQTLVTMVAGLPKAAGFMGLMWSSCVTLSTSSNKGK